MDRDREIRGVCVDSSDPYLSKLEPLLWSFIEIVEAFCRSERAPPYWFNERASVSLLSGAAWRTGWIAIEEYTTRKVMLERANELDLSHRYGRCDLYAKEQGGLTFAFEAKQVMSKSDRFAADVTAALRSARDDAAQLLHTEAAARIALVFAVPQFPVGAVESRGGIDHMVTTLLHGVEDDELSGPEPAITNGLFRGNRRATHAYVFPPEMRDCKGPAEKAYWPGVIVIAQRVKRSRTSELRPKATLPSTISRPGY